MYARLPRRVSSYNEPVQLAMVCSGCQQLAARRALSPFPFPLPAPPPFRAIERAAKCHHAAAPLQISTSCDERQRALRLLYLKKLYLYTVL